MWDFLIAAFPYAVGFFVLIGLTIIVLKIAEAKRFGRKEAGNDGASDDNRTT